MATAISSIPHNYGDVFIPPTRHNFFSRNWDKIKNLVLRIIQWVRSFWTHTTFSDYQVQMLHNWTNNHNQQFPQTPTIVPNSLVIDTDLPKRASKTSNQIQLFATNFANKLLNQLFVIERGKWKEEALKAIRTAKNTTVNVVHHLELTDLNSAIEALKEVNDPEQILAFLQAVIVERITKTVIPRISSILNHIPFHSLIDNSIDATHRHMNRYIRAETAAIHEKSEVEKMIRNAEANPTEPISVQVLDSIQQATNGDQAAFIQKRFNDKFFQTEFESPIFRHELSKMLNGMLYSILFPKKLQEMWDLLAKPIDKAEKQAFGKDLPEAFVGKKLIYALLRARALDSSEQQFNNWITANLHDWIEPKIKSQIQRGYHQLFKLLSNPAEFQAMMAYSALPNINELLTDLLIQTVFNHNIGTYAPNLISWAEDKVSKEVLLNTLVPGLTQQVHQAAQQLGQEELTQQKVRTYLEYILSENKGFLVKEVLVHNQIHSHLEALAPHLLSFSRIATDREANFKRGQLIDTMTDLIIHPLKGATAHLEYPLDEEGTRAQLDLLNQQSINNKEKILNTQKTLQQILLNKEEIRAKVAYFAYHYSKPITAIEDFADTKEALIEIVKQNRTSAEVMQSEFVTRYAESQPITAPTSLYGEMARTTVFDFSEAAGARSSWPGRIVKGISSFFTEDINTLLLRALEKTRRSKDFLLDISLKALEKNFTDAETMTRIIHPTSLIVQTVFNNNVHAYRSQLVLWAKNKTNEPELLVGMQDLSSQIQREAQHHQLVEEEITEESIKIHLSHQLKKIKPLLVTEILIHEQFHEHLNTLAPHLLNFTRIATEGSEQEERDRLLNLITDLMIPRIQGVTTHLEYTLDREAIRDKIASLVTTYTEKVRQQLTINPQDYTEDSIKAIITSLKTEADDLGEELINVYTNSLEINRRIHSPQETVNTFNATCAKTAKIAHDLLTYTAQQSSRLHHWCLTRVIGSNSTYLEETIKNALQRLFSDKQVCKHLLNDIHAVVMEQLRNARRQNNAPPPSSPA